MLSHATIYHVSAEPPVKNWNILLEQNFTDSITEKMLETFSTVLSTLSLYCNEPSYKCH